MPDGVADKDAREADIIASLDRLALPVARGGIGRYPAAFAFWTNLGENVNPYSPRAAFLSPTLTAALDQRGITPMINLQPVGPGISRTAVVPPLEALRYSNAAIAAGSFDDFLTSWAEGAAAYGRTVILRFAWEMNGSWFPWSPTQDRARYYDLGNTPATYIAAWQHVHEVIHGIAPNVRFLWAPSVTDIGSAWEYYPGPQSVDYLGLDGYERSAGKSSMVDLFGRAIATLRELPGGGTLPIIIAETGITADNPDRAQWLSQGYRQLYATVPQLASVMYFDFDMTNPFNGNNSTDNWSLDSRPRMRAAYAALEADPRFQGTFSGYTPAAAGAPEPVP